MLAQVFASIFNAFSTILDKVVLSRHRADVHNFIIAIFIFLWFFTGLSLPWLGSINSAKAFSIIGIFYLTLLVIFALIWNVIYYRAQQHETVQEFEVIVMMQPLFISLMAAIIFADERNWHILAATAVASLALIFSHLRKDHLNFDQYSWLLILAVFFIAAEIQMRKLLLDWYSPAALYFVRTGILTVLFIFIWHPAKLAIPKKSWPHIVVSGLLGAAMMILSFYGYKNLGIVLTTLILMLGPILTYLLDFIILKEKLRPRIIIAAAVILGCILYAGLKA